MEFHNVLSLFFSMAGVGLGCWVRRVVGSLGPRCLGPRGLGATAVELNKTDTLSYFSIVLVAFVNICFSCYIAYA